MRHDPPFAWRPDRPLAIAHRGDSASHRENTLAALAAAFAAGVDGIEVDVRFTADGVPVLLHDRSLARTTGLRRRLETVTSTALRSLEERRRPQLADPPHRVPTLAEALALLAGRVPILLEVKVDRPLFDTDCGAEQRLLEVIEDSPDPRGCVVISFDPATLHRVHGADPDLPLGVLWSPAVTPDLDRLLGELGTDLVLLPVHAATPAWVAELRERGRRVLVYTADGEVLESVLGARPDGILGNDAPALVRRLRAAASAW